MKRILISAGVTLGILAIGLLPNATHTTSAYPENLWTSGGQFGEPSKTQALLHWKRTEYGLPWAWLVRDTCTTEPAWYARIEPRYLVLYSAVALFGGVAATLFIRLKKRQPIKP
jgi:hypothetical protein